MRLVFRPWDSGPQSKGNAEPLRSKTWVVRSGNGGRDNWSHGISRRAWSQCQQSRPCVNVRAGGDRVREEREWQREVQAWCDYCGEFLLTADALWYMLCLYESKYMILTWSCLNANKRHELQKNQLMETSNQVQVIFPNVNEVPIVLTVYITQKIMPWWRQSCLIVDLLLRTQEHGSRPQKSPLSDAKSHVKILVSLSLYWSSWNL